MDTPDWHDLGDLATLQRKPLQEVTLRGKRLAVSCVNGEVSVPGGRKARQLDKPTNKSEGAS